MYLIFCKSLNLVLIFFFLVCLYLLTNDFFPCFFVFCFCSPMSLKALGTRDHVMTLVSESRGSMKKMSTVWYQDFLDVF